MKKSGGVVCTSRNVLGAGREGGAARRAGELEEKVFFQRLAQAKGNSDEAVATRLNCGAHKASYTSHTLAFLQVTPVNNTSLS